MKDIKNSKKRRPKICCEVCGNKNKESLQYHHIVEQTEINTCNDDYNICVICASCHTLQHMSNRLKIIGVFPGTKPPSGKILIYELDGKRNIEGISDSYFKYTPPKIKI